MQSARDSNTVLVTGASGFIGRALVARLEETGKEVVRVSRAYGFDIARDRLPLGRVGHVFHLAARVGIEAAWEDPVGFLQVNSVGTARVLEQCRHHGCGITFVSAYVYGSPMRLPIAENHVVRPSNPYSLSKSIAEQLCSFYSGSWDVPAVVLRLFNAYGPGQQEDFLIPTIVRQIVNPKVAEIVVRDLVPRRDYVYLADIIDAILLASNAKSGSVFNVGSGVAFSVEDIIKHASAVAGEFKPYRAINCRRNNEVDTTVADIRAIVQELGWRPRVSIDRGLSEVIRSLRGQCTTST